MQISLASNQTVKRLFPWLFGAVGIILLSLFLGSSPSTFTSTMRTALIVSLWFFALITILLPIQYQIFILVAYLPFVDFLKRLVFLAPEASDVQMYLILATQDIMLVMIFLKLLLGAFLKPIKFRWYKGDLILILFFVYNIFSAISTPNAPISISALVIGMWVWPMVAYFIFGHLWSDEKSVGKLAKLIPLLGFIVAIYGIQQFFNGLLPHEVAWYLGADSSANVSHMQYEATRGSFRTFGTLDSHSSYGIFLGISLVLLWAIRASIGNLSWLFGSLIIGFGLILSFTRFTWLMPILSAAYIFIFTYRRVRPLFEIKKIRRASILLLIIVGSFFIFYLLMSFLYTTGLGSSSNPILHRILTTGTLSDRLRASDILLSSTQLDIFGSGLGSASYFASKFGYQTSDVDYHNIFIDMMDTLGIIGLGIFFIFLYFSIKQTLWNIYHESNPYTRKLLVSVFGLILGMITVGHFNGAVFYFGRAIPIYFWGMLGILTHYHNDSIETSLRNDQKNNTTTYTGRAKLSD